MAGNSGKRSSAPGNNSSLILGILIGMVLGLAVAGAVAWHLAKRSSPIVAKEQHESAPAAPATPPPAKAKAPVAAAPAAAPAASGVNDGKPRFEFYKILADKEGAAPKMSSHSGTSAATPKAAPKASGSAPVLLQAGSFANADEADRLKAKLALLGMEATVQTANVPGKGTYYRVRLGPYRTAEELNKASSTLKQNGINDAAQLRAQ